MVPDEGILYNPRLHKSYPVVDGVPVLLVDEASDVTDGEHDRLTAKAEKEGVRGDRATLRGERRAVPRHGGHLGRHRVRARAGAVGAGAGVSRSRHAVLPTPTKSTPWSSSAWGPVRRQPSWSPPTPRLMLPYRSSSAAGTPPRLSSVPTPWPSPFRSAGTPRRPAPPRHRR